MVVCFCLFVRISLTTDGSQHARLLVPPIATLPSCLWPLNIFPSLPGSQLRFFYRDVSSSTLHVVHQPMVEFYLLHTVLTFTRFLLQTEPAFFSVYLHWRLCMCCSIYLCSHNLHWWQIMDQPDSKVAKSARGQLNRENGVFPVPVRA